MQKQSYKERERQRREQEILNVAGRLMAERGYHELSMDELADQVGISKPTLYQHFKSKEDLAAHVLTLGLQKIEENIVLSIGQLPIKRLEQIFRLMLNARYGPEAFLSALGLDVVISTFRKNSTLAAQKKHVMDLLHAIVEEGKCQGQICPRLDSDVVVRSLFCLQNAVVDFTAVAAQQADSAEIIASAIDSVAQLFIQGIGNI